MVVNAFMGVEKFKPCQPGQQLDFKKQASLKSLQSWENKA
jgi:hypothetical protein